MKGTSETENSFTKITFKPQFDRQDESQNSRDDNQGPISNRNRRLIKAGGQRRVQKSAKTRDTHTSLKIEEPGGYGDAARGSTLPNDSGRLAGLQKNRPAVGKNRPATIEAKRIASN